MAMETRPIKPLFEQVKEPRTVPKEPTTCAMEARDRSSFPAGSIFGVPRKRASPPEDLHYPHWSDPVRVAECHFFEPPPRFEAPQPRKTTKASGSQVSQSTRSQVSQSTRASSSRSGARQEGRKSSSRRSHSSAGSYDSRRSSNSRSKNIGGHVSEIQPWGAPAAEKKKDRPYHASIESVYEIRVGCRKMDGTPVAHNRAGVASAQLKDHLWCNFYNNPDYGGPHYKPKMFGHSKGPQAAGISTGGYTA